METTHHPATSSSNDRAAACFVRGEPVEGTADLSVDGDVLLVGRIAVALRVGPSTVFVRGDLPAELADFRLVVERALAAEGMTALDRDSALAGPVVPGRLNVGSARWDLWGPDLATVFGVLTAHGGSSTATDALVTARPPVPQEPSAAAEPASGAGGGRRPRWLLPVAGLLVLAVLGLLLTFTLGQRNSSRKSASKAAGASASPAPTTLVDYRDPRGRFTLKYPSTWKPEQSTDANVPLLLIGPAGGSMLVRIVPLAKAVDPTKVADIKAVTDVIVETPSVQILQQKAIDLSGLRGYYYLYSFADAGSQQQGVHSHFFLFRGKTMHTLVFQALPTDAFTRLAPDFDRIAQSYRALS